MAMHNAGELAARALQARPESQSTCTNTSSAKRESLPGSWIVRLFAKLHARYGVTFARQYPSEELRELAMAEWAERLAGITGEQIAHGLQHWSGDWPPNVEQFRRACIGDGQHRGAAYRPFPPALPKPKAKPETAAAALAAMRARPVLGPQEREEERRVLQSAVRQ